MVIIYKSLKKKNTQRKCISTECLFVSSFFTTKKENYASIHTDAQYRARIRSIISVYPSGRCNHQYCKFEPWENNAIHIFVNCKLVEYFCTPEQIDSITILISCHNRHICSKGIESHLSSRCIASVKEHKKREKSVIPQMIIDWRPICNDEETTPSDYLDPKRSGHLPHWPFQGLQEHLINMHFIISSHWIK